jgi:hypothetical protein
MPAPNRSRLPRAARRLGRSRETLSSWLRTRALGRHSELGQKQRV